MSNFEMERSDGRKYEGTIAFPPPTINGHAILLDEMDIELILKTNGLIINTNNSKFGKVFVRYNSISCIHNYKYDNTNYYLIITMADTIIHYRYYERLKNFTRIEKQINSLLEHFIQ